MSKYGKKGGHTRKTGSGKLSGTSAGVGSGLGEASQFESKSVGPDFGTKTERPRAEPIRKNSW